MVVQTSLKVKPQKAPNGLLVSKNNLRAALIYLVCPNKPNRSTESSRAQMDGCYFHIIRATATWIYKAHLFSRAKGCLHIEFDTVSLIVVFRLKPNTLVYQSPLGDLEEDERRIHNFLYKMQINLRI
jgi:hypothetical protein